LLDAGVQSDKEDTDMRWSKALRDEVMDVPVEMIAKLAQTEMSLREVMELREGDVIPLELPDDVTVLIEDLPSFHAKMGRSRDNVALKISEKIKRPETVKSDIHMLTRGGRRIGGDAELQQLEEDIDL
jgi:flagellar motor switch protein FliM